MRVCLSHYSALRIIRYARTIGASFCKIDKLMSCNKLPSKKDIYEIQITIKKYLKLNLKLDILQCESARRNSYDFARFHYFNKTINTKYYCQIKCSNADLQNILFDKIIITSPELTFIQIAKNTNFTYLMQWGLELCGTYSIDRLNIMGFYSNLLPVTNVNKITKACSNVLRCRYGNVKFALYVSKWLQNYSASPAETNLFILLCGPRKYGFFQINKMNLNATINLSAQASKICGLSKIRPDLSIHKKKIAIEYDSSAFHNNYSQNLKDKSRVLALQHDGWKVITIIHNEMSNYLSFSIIAKDILRYLGQDTRFKSRHFSQKSLQAFNKINICRFNAIT